MQVQTQTLGALYTRLNPTASPALDACELRANADTAPLRVKTAARFFTHAQARAAHQAHARHQVRVALGQSIRQQLDLGPSADIRSYMDPIWQGVTAGGTAIRLRMVAEMNRRVVALGAALQPAEGVHWHPTHSPTAPLGRTPSAAAAASPVPPAASSPAPVAAQPAAPASPARVPAPTTPALTATAPAPAAARTGAARPAGEASPVQRPARAPSAASLLATLKRQYDARALENLTAHEQAHFHGQLEALVGLIQRKLPRLLAMGPEEMAIVRGAAERIRVSAHRGMAPSVALYAELRFKNLALARALLEALPPAEADAVIDTLQGRR